MLGAEAIAYLPVAWHLSAVKFPSQGNKTSDEAAMTGTDVVSAAILKALGDNSFSLCASYYGWPACPGQPSIDV
jgi:hypothetical protein